MDIFWNCTIIVQCVHIVVLEMIGRFYAQPSLKSNLLLPNKLLLFSVFTVTPLKIKIETIP